MTFDPVPWFVGGGAHHSPEVARLLAYAATSGAEGVVAPGDLKVVPLDVPGSSVRALAGAAVILSKAAGGAQQTYVGRNPSEEVVGISATGSGSGRSDLVIARVEDPFMPGEPWSDPEDVTSGPYIFVRVIPNVAAGTTTVPAGTSGIPLARIDVPANTATITAGMIVDLRKVANPRRETVHTRVDMAYAPDDMGSPTYAPFPNVSTSVAIPSWATKAVVRLDITGVQARDAALDGRFRASLGGSVYTRETYFNEQVVGDTRNNYVVSDTVNIPAAMRGTNQVLRPEAIRSNGTGFLRNLSDTQVVFEVTFIEGAA